MKMDKKRYTAAFVGTAAFLLLFFFSEEFSEGAAIGLGNCFRVIIPSLFPFMVAASLLGEGGIPPLAKRLLEPLTLKLFGQPAESIPAIFVGLLGGYPSGARAALSLCKNGKISSAQAKSLMLFCVNSGAGFCVNAVGISLLGSERAGMIIFVSLCVSALITGMFSKSDEGKAGLIKIEQQKSFSEIFVGSVASGASGIINVCAFTVLFSGILRIISASGIGGKALIPIACLLEISSGCAEAAGRIPIPLIAGACAFGGLCVHMQILSVAGEMKPDIGKFMLFRVLHAVLSTLICSLLLRLFPVSVQTFLPISQNARLSSFSVPASVSLLFFSALLIFDLDKQRKIC